MPFPLSYEPSITQSAGVNPILKKAIDKLNRQVDEKIKAIDFSDVDVSIYATKEVLSEIKSGLENQISENSQTLNTNTSSLTTLETLLQVFQRQFWIFKQIPGIY